MKKLFRLFISITLISLISGCSSEKKSEQEDLVRGAEDIEVSVEEVKEHVKTKEHTKELKGDKKDFYYSLKDKKIDTDASNESFTRLDAQKNIQNQTYMGQISEKRSVNSPYTYIQIDLLKSDLSKNFIVKCSSCHDDYANGIIGPSLLHRDGDFIFKRLKEYRNKEKVNVLMRDLVNNMSEEELKSLSEEIAKFNEQVRKLD